jgi:uncharacterized protein with PIN domain
MLGKLASWLRLAGYDAAYRTDVADAELAREARETGRVLLTRDVELAAAAPDPPGALLVESRDPHEQLQEVVAGLDLPLDEDRILSRCSECNTPVDEVEPGAVADEVPGDVADEFRTFWRCPGCERVYWPGSHVDAIREILAGLRDP